jgi:hypothetical protein
MITVIPRLSSGHPCVTLCRTDADIWDAVLARCAGMRLETISRAADRADGEWMYARTAARDEPAASEPPT